MIDLEDLIRRVVLWGWERNLNGPECLESQTLKLVSEYGEIYTGIIEGKEDDVADGIGDVLVVAILTGERLGHHIDPNLIECVADGHPDSVAGFVCTASLGLLADLIAKRSYEAAKLELDKFIVLICAMARELDLDPILCLADSYVEIKDRKGIMYNGVFIKEKDPRYPEVLKELGRNA